MKNIKKPSLVLALFLTTCALSLYDLSGLLAASNQVKTGQSPADAPASMDEIDYERLLDRLDELKQGEQIEPPCTAQSVVNSLTGIGVVNILKKHPIYIRSNSILNRSLHDLPTFNWICNAHDNCLDLGVFPFYNQTSKMFFTDSDPFIDSYLNLSGKDFIDEIAEITQAFFKFSPEEILPLFRNIKLQERRVGLFFRICTQQQFTPQEYLTLQFSVPVLYLERNFFLTPEERQRIRSSEVLNEFATNSSEDEAEQLLREHLVGDKLGLGDMRLYGMYTPYDTPGSRFSCGGFLTLPTAHAFKEGLIGGTFCKTQKHPEIHLKELICSLFLETTKDPSLVTRRIRSRQELANLSFSVLDHLTANVANTSLGNNSHVTIAPVIEYEYRPDEYVSLLSQFSVQYVAPSQEPRYFIKKINSAAFNRNFEDPKIAEANLRFIEKAIIDSFFPKVINVTVKPGPIIDFHTAVRFNYDCVRASFGYDYWWQGKERIEFDHKTHGLLIGRALNPHGEQHKLFGSFGVDIPQEPGIFHVGFRWDATVASHGIGKDYTLALDVRFIY